MTLPLCRYGPASDAASKLMYCSPAGERADTCTTLFAGIRTLDVMLAIAFTPVSVICSDSTRPTRTPQCDILVGQQATGFRQLHGDPVGRGEGLHPQRADHQVGGRDDQDEHQSGHRQPDLPPVTGPHRPDGEVGEVVDGADHGRGPGAGGARRDIDLARDIGVRYDGNLRRVGPRPTTRSCSRHRVYLRVPTSRFTL